MDQRLIAWGFSVKDCATPPLWMFTDPARMADVVALAARLPKGLSGIVFRHDGVAARAALGAALAQVCRARRIGLVVAGDARLAARLGAGVHLRGGRRPGLGPLPRLRTASAHGATEVVRARRAGARIIFCSPVFATGSHPGARALGGFHYRRLARFAGGSKAYALGGIDGKSVRLLGKSCAGMGGIDAFLCKSGVEAL